ncbi:P-loop ATPase, Sll1717 family [Actinoplanes rectilineatus]|uniref:P-loop ATPase, Sll1717 family n=1 Tax=Actinoplanes rectilineatus TaxID=113571 RepID=UPI000A775130|nr:hypothetical protein [Actinoplanes rectilineatus]
MLSVFFGYASDNKGRVETIRSAASSIASEIGVDSVLWQDMRVDGAVIINRIFEAIDSASMCVFDLTDLNENVLFEAGYAAARGKPLWLTFDQTVANARKKINSFAILSPIGLVPYSNSKDLRNRFLSENPIATLTPVYDDLIDPNLPDDPHQDSLYYSMTFESFEASNRLSSFLDRRRQSGLSLLVSDPRESALDPITWIAPTLARSAGSLIHFAGRSRRKASLHNRRNAFIAGLAHGLESQVLLLAEDDYNVPFDLVTVMKKYSSAAQCVSIAEEWLSNIDFHGFQWTSRSTSTRSPLSGLRFGQHVAENELQELSDYFIQTAAFEDVVAARDTIFVGQRGTGKTANAIQAFETVSSNKTNMGVLIKPPGFEFPALLAIIEKLPEFQHDYFFDSLWRFVIQTEMASSVFLQLSKRTIGVPLDKVEQEFLTYATTAPFDITGDITTRLDQALDNLIASVDNATTADKSRSLINEAFHDRHLSDLRAELGKILNGKKRVAIFVDNLDKGWQKGADFKLIARLILGLLSAKGRVIREFERHDWWRHKVKLTMAIFLRSDIYRYLHEEAREPDKLPISSIDWQDKETLYSLIEERFVTGATENRSRNDLWNRYFCQEVQGLSTKDFISRYVLPRPRDIVFYCNEAVGRAINRRHNRVEAEDFTAALETYSTQAHQALLVENGVTIPELEDALFGLLGADSVITRSKANLLLSEAGFTDNRAHAVIQKLIDASFFGLETSPGSFTHTDVGPNVRRAIALAKRLQPDAGKQQLQIHPAYHSFLAIN